jgi:hypothetical protein
MIGKDRVILLFCARYNGAYQDAAQGCGLGDESVSSLQDMENLEIP